jgi:DegV family protein with EDD domain
MENDYLIFTDVSADVNLQYAQEQKIRFVPMYITVEEHEILCDGHYSAEFIHSFYDGLRNGTMCRTSQVNPQMYIDLFQPLLEQGNNILYISLSSGLSNTYSSACMAIRELEETYGKNRVYVVDSLSASSGINILVEYAVKQRNQKIELKDTVQELLKLRTQIGAYFIVDDLIYLKRGGRISAATALAGTALNLKPILCITPEGKLEPIAKKRGYKAAMQYLLEQYRGNEAHTAYIIHGDNEQNALRLEELLRSEFPKIKTEVVALNPVIGTHTGPGLLALLYIKRDFC